MKSILQVFLLTIILFSCKTSYDKGYVMQCNKSKEIEDIKRLESSKKKFIDSIYLSTIRINTIDILTSFIKNFPQSDYIKDVQSKRQKLFQIKEEVEKSQFDIDELLKRNPCYIPIYKNIDYVRGVNIKFENLINSRIDSTSPYKNRFLVGDLNTKDKDGKSKGISESFFRITEGWEFKDLLQFAKDNNITNDSLIKISSIPYNPKIKKEIIEHQLKLYKNYWWQVGQYMEEEINKKYSSYRGYKYTGQKLCFCEISNDTILLIAEHATSARGKTRHLISEDSITGEQKFAYSEAFPIRKERKYYAAHNRITIRNWETQRIYTNEDKYRDSVTGGGNSRVTFFDGKSQLPNFLLIEPDNLYPKAMNRNGIHEGSLSNMSRCMLGTPQSLGCFRTTDFGSKFSRWWIPKHANLYISYDDDQYSNKEIERSEMNGIRIPFKNDEDGNKFRVWVNNNHPKFAKDIDLEEKGSCNNCFIQAAWEEYYIEYLKTKEGSSLNFTLPQTTFNHNKQGEKEVIDTNTLIVNEEIDLKQFDILEEYYIIIGCFKELKNAHSYSKKIMKLSYPTFVFYEKNAKCNFVSIGPYQDKQKSLSDLPSIQRNIDEESWIYTKVIR